VLAFFFLLMAAGILLSATTQSPLVLATVVIGKNSGQMLTGCLAATSARPAEGDRSGRRPVLESWPGLSQPQRPRHHGRQPTSQIKIAAGM
jgi:hypothetical protein